MLRGYAPHTWSNKLCNSFKISIFYLRFAIRYASDFTHLREELTSRRLPLLCDPATVAPSVLLTTTLSDFLPPRSLPLPELGIEELKKTSSLGGRFCRPGHHLVYFPPPVPLSSLLPDGTDPAQSPGGPYVRRMWAGGKMNFANNIIIGDPQRSAFCVERISDVSIKGSEGQEKIYVTIERRMLSKSLLKFSLSRDNTNSVASSVENRGLMENRTLVFMRQRDSLGTAKVASPEKILKPQHEPTFSHTLTPTAALLFRFSALTYNAHAIHLDKEYCRKIEGHRNLLVHGPLSLVLMLEVLILQVTENVLQNAGNSDQGVEYITGIEYRNLAPLYAEEEMKICGRKRCEGEYDLWIEGENGGYAVKGLATTRRRPEREMQSTFKHLKANPSAATP